MFNHTLLAILLINGLFLQPAFAQMYGISEHGLLQFQTYIPNAKYGSYIMYHLLPQTDVPNCEAGTLYIDTAENRLNICSQGAPFELNRRWTRDSNDEDLIYPKSTTSKPNLKVGIGTDNPQTRLHLSQMNDDNETNDIMFRTVDIHQNSGIQMITQGVPINSENFISSLTFIVGQSQIYSAIQYFHDIPSFPFKGLGISSSNVPTSNINIWLDGNSANIGIDTLTPSEKLTVNGNMQSERIFLKSNNLNVGELKFEHVAGQGYYPVFAP